MGAAIPCQVASHGKAKSVGVLEVQDRKTVHCWRSSSWLHLDSGCLSVQRQSSWKEATWFWKAHHRPPEKMDVLRINCIINKQKDLFSNFTLSFTELSGKQLNTLYISISNYMDTDFPESQCWKFTDVFSSRAAEHPCSTDLFNHWPKPLESL